VTAAATAGSDRGARFAAIQEALAGSLRGADRMVAALHPGEVALLLESLPPRPRLLAWELVEPGTQGEVLVELSEEVRSELLEGMQAHELVAATEGLETDDLADLLAELPEALMRQVLRSMDQQDRDRLSRVLEYPPDTASGLMNTDTVTVRPDVPVEAVLRYLRMRGELPEPTDRLFVVDRNDRYLGALPVTRLLTADPGAPVAAQMDPEAASIPPELPADEVAALFESRDLVSAAVVSADGKLLGRITVDDVVDVVREQAGHASLAAAGLEDEEDVFAGVRKSARRRALWLGINLMTAFFASWVVGFFEATIEKVVALAVLMPVVASMGGIAGTQTVTLIIRAIAVGQVQPSNARWLFFKELGVGALNGLAWAAVIALATWSWFGTWDVAAVMFAAIVINLVAAAAAGVLIPLGLKRFRIDPALAGGVILTTVTDVVGFAALLGLGTLFLACGAAASGEADEGADLRAAAVCVALPLLDQSPGVRRLEQQVGNQPPAPRAARAEDAQQRPQRPRHRLAVRERRLRRVRARLHEQRVDVAHGSRRRARLAAREQHVHAVQALEVRLQALHEQRVEQEAELLGHVRGLRALGPRAAGMAHADDEDAVRALVDRGRERGGLP
jgi:magnesium transporter